MPRPGTLAVHSPCPYTKVCPQHQRKKNPMEPVSGNSEHRPFVTDIQELRRRAREHMEMGAVTGSYAADRETVIRILNEVLATEIVCVLRYKRHYYMAT